MTCPPPDQGEPLPLSGEQRQRYDLVHCGGSHATGDLSLYPAILESMDGTVTFPGPGLASLPGCPGLSNPHPVVSLRSTTGYTLGCLRHSNGGRRLRACPFIRGSRLVCSGAGGQGAESRVGGERRRKTETGLPRGIP